MNMGNDEMDIATYTSPNDDVTHVLKTQGRKTNLI